ncbi:MAG: GNAT family N-acetyltransferase [Solirubrobacteraceae bacterium]
MDLYALPDGRVIVIRPIRPEDRERLRASHAQLSPLTRYRRFMSPKPYLSIADATYLAEIDGRNHYALVATFAPGEGEESIIGVARFVRALDDPRAAEFAIVVGDDWQGQGIGRELLGRLADAAVTLGVDRFQATMLAENLAIQRLSEQLAAGPMHRVRAGATLEVEFALPTRVSDVPAMIAGCAGS